MLIGVVLIDEPIRLPVHDRIEKEISPLAFSPHRRKRVKSGLEKALKGSESRQGGWAAHHFERKSKTGCTRQPVQLSAHFDDCRKL